MTQHYPVFVFRHWCSKAPEEQHHSRWIRHALHSWAVEGTSGNVSTIDNGAFTTDCFFFLPQAKRKGTQTQRAPQPPGEMDERCCPLQPVRRLQWVVLTEQASNKDLRFLNIPTNCICIDCIVVIRPLLWSTDSQDLQNIRSGVNEWNKFSCVNIRPATRSDRNYINVVSNGGGWVLDNVFALKNAVKAHQLHHEEEQRLDSK